jgi:hypothetical protein
VALVLSFSALLNACTCDKSNFLPKSKDELRKTRFLRKKPVKKAENRRPISKCEGGKIGNNAGREIQKNRP